MHNIVHNMADDDVPVANHLTTRNGVCQYVRRVPEDLRDAFSFARVQLSLKTRDQRAAREKALALDLEWDRRFAEARQRRGLASAADHLPSIDATGWGWEDWEALSRWFGASLLEDDWRERLRQVRGSAFAPVPEISDLPRRSNADVKEHFARERTLRAMTIGEYATERSGFVQGYVRRLGVSLSRTSQHHDRFMAACLEAELTYLDVFRQRESRLGGLGTAHPDTIAGPWRKARPEQPGMPEPIAVQKASVASTAVDKTLADCATKWCENRRLAKKQVRPEYLREMEHAILAFTAHSGVKDIGEIKRKHVLAYRDHLGSANNYAIQTINKKVGFISALLATALNAGWVETPLGKEIYLEIPEDEDFREPYSDAELKRIFTHPIFTEGKRFTKVKACEELQFWLPLIACLHGMISSEIIQLGPDSIMPHPDAPDTLCFVVTNAGDRRVKTLARRRWVPVRRELLDLGLLDLVEAARAGGREFLWSAMTRHDHDVTRVSGYFSSFWADLSRKDLTIESEGTTLYSFRHAFQDALSGAGHADEVKKALMGHAEGGMTKRYGTKRKPRVVNIGDLDEAVQGLDWAFLPAIRRTS